MIIYHCHCHCHFSIVKQWDAVGGFKQDFLKAWSQTDTHWFLCVSSLIFLGPSIEPLGFWEVLWTVGVTNFIIKFLMMGTKCLILLPPSSLLSFRSQVESGSQPTHHQSKPSKRASLLKANRWLSQAALFDQMSHWWLKHKRCSD